MSKVGVIVGAAGAAAVALAAAMPMVSAAPAGDPVRGKVVFARCAACHQVAPGRNGLGPTMAGVVGRRAAAVPGYAYSPAMKNSKIVWTPKNLDTYLIRPAAMVPGTKMAFVGLPNPADRAAVIAYLGTLK